MPYDNNWKHYLNSFYKDKIKKRLSKKSLLKLGLICFFGMSSLIFIAIWRNQWRNHENVKAVKKAIYEGYSECDKRWKNYQSTNFTDIATFLVKYNEYEIKPNPSFKIQRRIRRGNVLNIEESFSNNSCFSVIAVPKNNKNTWFKYEAIAHDIKYDLLLEIERRYIKGEFSCGDPSKTGCPDNGNFFGILDKENFKFKHKIIPNK